MELTIRDKICNTYVLPNSLGRELVDWSTKIKKQISAMPFSGNKLFVVNIIFSTKNCEEHVNKIKIPMIMWFIIHTQMHNFILKT